MSLRRTLLTVGVGFAAAAGATAAAERRWKSNPDPLQGEVPRFPDGDTIVVPSDDGAELKIQRAGNDDDPVVVLVHGITSNADDWGPVARRLVESGHRVIGINQRGHNDSTVGADGHGAARLGRDIHQVLAALDLRGVVLVGHSMGGIAAMSYAVDHPADLRDRVRGLCLIATLARTNDAEGRVGLALIAGRPATASGGSSPAIDRLRRRLARFVFGRKPSWELLGHAVETAMRCPDDTRIGAARALSEYDIADQLPTIDVPTTVVCGTADLVTHHRKNTAIAAAIPGAKMVSLAGVGHMPLWEAPDALTAEITALVPVG